MRDDIGRSKVQEWIDERAKTKVKRDRICDTLAVSLLPFLRDWVAQRTGSDPITGNQVFSLRDGLAAGEGDRSSDFIPQVLVEAFDGTVFEVTVPLGRAVIRIVEPVGGEHDYVAVRPGSGGESPMLESEAGASVSFIALLDRFEQAVLQSPIW